MGSRPTYEELEKRVLELEKSEIKSKQASKDIKSSILFLHTLVDINPFPMWASDREGMVILANRSLCETIQLTDDNIIGQYNVLKDKNLESQGGMPLVRAVFENHESVRFRIPWKARLAGEVEFGTARDMIIDVSMFPILDDRGELLNVVCQWVDTTDQKRAEDALKQSEDRFRRLSENATDMIYRMSLPDGIYEYVSPASVNVFGYRPQDFYNTPLLIKNIIHPDWHGYFGKEWSNLLKGKVPPSYEYQIVHKDKGLRWVNQRNTLEKDENGIPIAIAGVVTDITERKKAEEELVKSRTELRILVDTIPDLVWLKDPDGIYLGCNQKFEQFFGAKESTIVGKSDYDFIDKDLADFFRDYDQKVIELNKQSVNEEWLTFSEDGYRGLFETIKTPMRDPSGTLIGVLGIARDITERKKAEDALIQNEQRYKSAQRMGLVGNWEYDLVSETFWGSDQAKRIYGFAPDSDRFTSEEVEKCIPERQRVHQALIDLIEKNKPYNLEFEINPVSGPKTKTIKSIAELIKDDQNTPLKVVGVIQDITSQKESAKERLILEQKLLQAQKMESIGNLAGGIAHDFNNILSSVLGFSELALDEVEKGSSMEDNLQEIYAGGLRAKEVVNQILAFARQSDEEKKPTRVAVIIIEALKLIRPSTPSTIEIRKEIESSSLVIGNATQIHQIMMNLCTNAAHAMQDNGGIMEVTLKDVHFGESINIPGGLEQGKYIELAISDTGCGIELEHIDSIFDPYFTTKETGKGTGMGLAM
ncbi:MAG: PAS domain S-box protein, partial [Proteobacteria bacterium]|nr:PAS domain S-box protein [Pseudomonadota bacterium]